MIIVSMSVLLTIMSINGQTKKDSLSINDKKLSTPDTMVPDYLYNKPKLENITPTAPGINSPSPAIPEIPAPSNNLPDISAPSNNLPDISAPSERTGMPDQGLQVAPDTSGTPGAPLDSRDMTPAPGNPVLPDQTPLPD